MRYDILIRGGVLLDGSGAAGKPGDLAIRDGRIAAVGGDLGGDAAQVIDAEGLVVAPGFIDIKTHSDFTLPINPKAESKVRQGRDHRDHRPLRLLGRAGAARQGRAHRAIISARARRGCRFARPRLPTISTRFRRPP